MSKKPKSKSKPRKANLIEIGALLIMAMLIILIAIAAIFNQTPYPIRLFFVAVETITIEDNWSGYSDIASIKTSYHLNFQDGGLVGTADFSVGFISPLRRQNILIEIPVEVTQAFFLKLKESELVESEYQPQIMWTDDYPSLSITIDTRREVLELYSRSQGEEHSPWGAYIRDTEYIIDSGLPAEALSIIEPYLKKELLDEMIQEYRANR